LDSESVADRLAILDTASFAPDIFIWCKAIDNGHFTWPDLNSFSVCKHFPKSVATGKGQANL
jgi:hypothetical protein